MGEEDIKQLMKEEMLKTIKNDLHSEMIFVYVDNLEKENKQLKEKLEKKNKMYWQQQCAYYSSILYSLEEWLKEHIEICKHNANIITEGSIEKKRLNYRAIIYEDVLDKIQELKEKYK